MTSFKQQFNKKYKQPANASNSKANISKLTGIPVKDLNRVFDETMKYPATHGYTDLNVKMPKGAYAMVRVYKYALENRRK